jgi:chromosome segregation ATPase
MPGDEELKNKHIADIASLTESTKQAHLRISGLVELIQNFTAEMRESNKNIGNMVNQVGILTEQIKHVIESIKRHDDDISEIKDNMETKDTVLNLYKKIEDSNEKHEKGMDAIMTKLRETETSLEEHKREPEKEALAREKALKDAFGKLALQVIGALAVAVTLLYFGLK